MLKLELARIETKGKNKSPWGGLTVLIYERLMSIFADDTKLGHRARNPDDIMELQEVINKLVEWANKWQMSFNIDKCSVMHIGHNNIQSNYNMSNQ